VTNDAPESGQPEDSSSHSDDAADRLAVRTEERAAATKAARPHIPVWQESIILLVVAVLLAVVLKAFFVQAFYIPSESMEPGLVKNDRILVQKPSYWTGSPSRGDVVVFEDPGNWLGENDAEGATNPIAKVLEKVGLMPTGGHLVKRVIGIPGDTVKCCDDQGRIQVNGVAIDEKGYARPGKNGQRTCYGPMTGNCSWSAGPVPAGSVFVMGDNRQHSADSTVHLCLEGETDCTKNPYISDDLIVGKVFALVWPLSHFGGVTGVGGTFDKVPDASK
jgi:signal peptidase I